MIWILSKAIFELYERAATDLPADVENKIKSSIKKEANKTAIEILNILLENTKLARKNKAPICQDTGTPIFYVYYPKRYSQKGIRKEITKATELATKRILRENAVDSLTGKNLGNIPLIKFKEWGNNFLKIELMLKGGGSENIGMIYKLPDSQLNADRNIGGIKKCIIDAVFKAQGYGCPPYVVGVGIAGSRDIAEETAKKQLFRKLDDTNGNKALRGLESELEGKLNKLGIGPAGLGGRTTVLGVKIASVPRHPASFFVAVSFSCWALRRYSLEYMEKKRSIK